jgi:Tol biopolymer transport system component
MRSRIQRSRRAARATGLAIAIACFVCLISVSVASAAYPGRNGKILFEGADLWKMNADGSHLKRLTTQGRDSDVVAAPVGRKIAFSRDAGPPCCASTIYTMRFDGSHEKRITQLRNVSPGSFSPNGKKILFERAGDLMTIRTDGTHLQEVVDGAFYVRPVFFPGGNRIVATNFEGIWIVSADGSQRRLLLGDSSDNFSETRPDISPNGNKVVFTRWSSRDNELEHAIHSIRIDGTHLKRLTSWGNSRAPVFSPDDKRIAYTDSWRGGAQIYKMRPDGPHKKRIPRSGKRGVAQEPYWAARRR